MINTYKFYLITLITFLSVDLSAQTTIIGKVINKRAKEGIPSATISILITKKATSTDASGSFRINLTEKESKDTIRFTAVGFKPLKIAVRELKAPIEINLQEEINALNEVAISDKRKELQLGNFNVASNVKPLNTGIELAKRFEMPATHQYLKEIIIRRDPIYFNQSPETKFRINIYGENSKTKGPGKKICSDTIEVNDLNSSKISINVARFNISIPNSIFFISVETLLTPYNERYRIYRAGKVVEGVREYTPYYEVCYQPHLSVGISKENESWVLSLVPGADWRKYEYTPAIIAIVN
jgi:hypothetical protein